MPMMKRLAKEPQLRVIADCAYMNEKLTTKSFLLKICMCAYFMHFSIIEVMFMMLFSTIF